MLNDIDLLIDWIIDQYKMLFCMKGISQSCAKILFVTSCTSQIVVKKKRLYVEPNT